jgi:ABC-2 type transport system permease protein
MTTSAYPSTLPASARLTDAWVLARRGLLRTLRTPQAAIAAVTSPVLFLVLFRYVFGGAIHITGLSYAGYLVPAMLIQNIVFGGFTSAAGVAQDARDGVLDRFRSLPSPPSAFLTGRCLSDLAVQWIAHALTIGAGFAIGFRIHASAASCAAAAGLLILTGISFFWVFAAIGLSTRNPETVQSLTPPFFLLLFVSSAFIPVRTLPGWLQGFAGHQPASVLTNALRCLTLGPNAQTALGHTTTYYLTASLAWCAAITATLATAALRAYRRP